MYRPKYFKESEFTRCTPPCKLSDMDELLMKKLDQAREIAKYPFVLNSAYRSIAYELAKGRKGTSSHTKGLAVDIACPSSVVRYYMVASLLSVGFRRIGVYDSFIHADLDDNKVSAIWLSDNNDVVRG